MTGRPDQSADDEFVYYVDTDPGIDDALALAYLFARDVPIVGLGTVGGNVDIGRATQNLGRLLAFFGRPDLAVFRGLDCPPEGPFWGGAPHVHGADGFGGISLPSTTVPVGDVGAASALVDLCEKYADRLRIIALGPLTNIAAALDLDESIAEQVESIVVMGGAIETAGNVTRYAEANIFADPRAANHVFAASWRRLFLVPLDLTHQHLFTLDDQALLTRSPARQLQTVGAMFDCYFAAYRDYFDGRSVPLHDPLAAAIAIGDIVPTDWRTAGLDVDDGTGIRRGCTTVVNGRGGTAVDVVNRVDRDCADVLLAALTEREAVNGR